jgi:hypothetical protein
MEEKEDKVIRIPSKEPTLMEQLDQWLRELLFPGNVEEFIEEISGHGDELQEERALCFYTEEYCYFINAIERFDEGKSYIGCQVNARKERAGEDWTRGNDLPDGPFNKETWNKIIYAIVNYEIVKLSPYRKPNGVPEDVA